MNVQITLTTGNGFSCIINSINLEEAMDMLVRVTTNLQDYKILSIRNNLEII